MKLTWFGGTAFRIHIGGQIVVIDAQAAPGNVDRGELVSGSDRVIALGDDLPTADGASWKARPRERLLDAGDDIRPVQLWSLGPDSLLIDADEDMPLLLLAGDMPQLGRWAERAVIVLVGAGLAARGSRLVAGTMPRLIVLAGDEPELATTFATLPPLLDGTGLMALEPGLAVEV